MCAEVLKDSKPSLRRVLGFIFVPLTAFTIFFNYRMKSFCEDEFVASIDGFKDGNANEGLSFLIGEGPFGSSCLYSPTEGEISYFSNLNSILITTVVIIGLFWIYHRTPKSKIRLSREALFLSIYCTVCLFIRSRINGYCTSKFDWNTSTFIGGFKSSSRSWVNDQGILSVDCSSNDWGLEISGSLEGIPGIIEGWVYAFGGFLLFVTIKNTVIRRTTPEEYLGSFFGILTDTRPPISGGGGSSPATPAAIPSMNRRYRCMRPGCGYEEHGQFVGMKKCLRCGSSMNHR